VSQRVKRGERKRRQVERWTTTFAASVIAELRDDNAIDRQIQWLEGLAKRRAEYQEKDGVRHAAVEDDEGDCE
jgi:hypothetical protein